MTHKLFNFYLVISVLFFSACVANEMLNVAIADGSSSEVNSCLNQGSMAINKRDAIGFLVIDTDLTNVWQVLCPLYELLADQNVKAVVLLLGECSSSNHIELSLLRDLPYLKSLYGKPIIAYSESRLGKDQYAIACGADVIVTAPLAKIGGLGFTLSRNYSFERDKKEGKILNLIYSGKFKSMDSYSLPAPEHLKIYEHLVNYAFNDFCNDLIKRRPKTAPHKDKWVEGNWFNAKESLALGLIDCIADKIDLVGYAINLAGSPSLNLTNIDLISKTSLQHLSTTFKAVSPHCTAGVIIIDTLDDQSSWSYREHLLKLFQDNAVNKIILHISSNGGSYEAEVSLYNDILKLKNIYKKQVVAYVDMALSGGYYIALAADYIIACPGSLIGSVGCRLERWNWTKKYKEEHIRTLTLCTCTSRALYDPTIPLDLKSKKILQEETDLIHAKFIHDIKVARPLLKEKEESSWAEAQVFTASEALQLNLIDKVGSITDACRFGLTADEELTFNFIFENDSSLKA